MTFSWETPAPQPTQRRAFSWEQDDDTQPPAAPRFVAEGGVAPQEFFRAMATAARDVVTPTRNGAPNPWFQQLDNMANGRDAYGLTAEDARRILAMNPATDPNNAAPPAPRPMSSGDAWLNNHLDALTLGNAPRLLGGIAAGIDTLTPEARGVSYADLYRARRDQVRGDLERSRRERPLESTVGSITGGVHLFTLPGVNRAAGLSWVPGIGPALTTAAAGRGVGALAAQSGLASLSGGLFGGIYGASSAPEGRVLEGGLEGARNGAMGGAIAPALFQGAGGVGRFLWNRPALRTGVGGAVGGGVGYLTGQNDEERQRNAAIGAATGAGIFGFGPTMFRSVRDMWQNAGRYAGQTNSSLGLPPPPAAAGGAGGRGGAAAAAAGGDEPLNPAVVRAFDDLAYETRQSPAALETRAAAAEAQPAGRVWADLFDDAGAMQARALAQGRGTTTGIARDEAERRSRSLAGRLVSELENRLGIRATPRQANESLSQAYQRVSDEHYNPILNGVRLSDDARAALDHVLERLPPEVRRATEESMQRVAGMRGQEALQPGDARFYHRFYSALGQTIRNLERNPSALDRQLFGADDLAAMRELRGVFRNHLDTAIPGYREARTAWAGLSDAEDAIDAGRSLIASNMVDGARMWRPDEVGRWMRGLSPFEREHVRIGVADELSRRFINSSRAVGNANAANSFNIEAQQNILREVFDDPRQAEAFINILNEGNVLQRNAQQWLGGSSTAANFQRAGQGWLSRGIEFAGQLGAPVTAAKNAALGVIRAMRENAAQQEDDAIGRALFTGAENATPEARQFRQRLLAALRELEARRLANASTAGIQGGSNAVWPSTFDDNNPRF